MSSDANTAWERVRRIFEDARLQPPERRRQFVDTTCAGDPATREQVVALLQAETDADLHGALIPPDEDIVAGWIDADRRGEPSAQRVGRCVLRRRLAVGGMGVVFEAEQEAPRRLVAMKLLRAALADDASRARFEQEVKILGGLQHPGIAQIYDAGVHVDANGDAVPYYVMELVRGARSILAYAKERDLDLRTRISLFAAACDAVQFGHGLGVVHRDLKPNNVLVDDEGHVKVIDFGIATTLGLGGVPPGDGLTQTGQILGTPAYMSPEQFSGVRASAGVRSDVYSLGAMLYELLTGSLPHDVRSLGLAEAARVVHERSVPAPETRSPEVPRDLSAAVRKALAIDPVDRYESAGALAEDLRRFLDGLPVRARPPSLTHQARLFARRRPAVASTSIALLLAVIVGAVLMGLSARRERDARERADEQRARAEGFLRSGREFVPWLLTTHQRAVIGLPKSRGVAAELVKGIRDHLGALAYEKATDPDLLVGAARSYSLLATVEAGLGNDTIDRPQDARVDAERALAILRRVAASHPRPDAYALEAGCRILLAKLENVARDPDSATRHADLASAAIEQAEALAGHRPIENSPSHRLEIAIVRSEIAESRDDLQAVRTALQAGIEAWRASGSPPILSPLALDLDVRLARSCVLVGDAAGAERWIASMRSVADDWARRLADPSDVLDARTTLYLGLVRIALATTKTWKLSPIPYLDLAVEALESWRSVAPDDRQVDREEVMLARRRSAFLLDARRYPEMRSALDRADTVLATLLRDDPADPAMWKERVETTLMRAELAQRLGHTDAVARQLAMGEELVSRIRRDFPDAKEAWVAPCRLVLTKAALDTVAAESEPDPSERRALLERAAAQTDEGGALYREATRHGLSPEEGDAIARMCDAESARIRAEIAAIAR